MIKRHSESSTAAKRSKRSFWRRIMRLATTAGVTLMLCQPAAQALNVGDLVLESGYGQPLKASIAVSIRRGEILNSGCITHATDNTETGFASLKDLNIVVPSAGVPGIYSVLISSPYPLTEPMYDLRLQIGCAGSSNFIRSFTLIPEVNQSGTVISAPKQKTFVQPEPIKVTEPTAQIPAEQRTFIAAGPLAPNSVYRVASTDSSSIASRITPASGRLKRRGEALLMANPDAFIDGDPQRIKAGSLIMIPDGMPTTKPEDLSLVSAQTSPEGGTLPPTGTDSPTNSNGIVSATVLNATAPAATTAAQSAPVAQVTASSKTAPAEEVRNLAPAYAKAGEIANAAAKEARVSELPAIETNTSAIPEPKRQSGSLLLAVIIGGLIGTLISLLIMSRRMWTAKRELRQPVIDLETTPRYANDDDFIAPVAPQHNFESTFVVDEDEDAFRKTIASDEHASRLMARMEDANSAGREIANETNDQLPKATVKSNFLDSDPDLFDRALRHSEPNPEIDTLQGIFNEALFTDQEDPDAPAENRVQAAKNATENVRRLVKTVKHQDDEDLSATLIDALHLLEQEYQDELTASQILDPEDVQKSLDVKQKR